MLDFRFLILIADWKTNMVTNRSLFFGYKTPFIGQHIHKIYNKQNISYISKNINIMTVDKS